MKNIFLLDMDDTLLDFPRAERTNFFATLAQFGVAADDGMFARFHAINDALWKQLERGETTREKLKEQRFRTLLSEYGILLDVSAVARAYWQNFPEICFPFEGARPFLAALHARGRVYICTNGGTAIQVRHIELAGFAPYLDGLFISEQMGADKPSQEYAAQVIKNIENFSAERAIYLGDSLTSDKECARVMGVDFVLFAPRGIPSGYPEAAASNFEDALKLMLR